VFTGEDVATNTADVSSNYEVMVRNGATNLVADDLTTWTDSGPVTTTSPSAGVYRVTATGAGSVTDTFASASLDRTGSYQARLISGDPSGSYVSHQLSTVDKGTPADLSSLTSGWSDTFDFKVTTADSTDSSAIVIASACVIEFRNMRVVDSDTMHPGFEIGSAAGATYGTDLVTCSPTWGTEGTIFQVFDPYGWSGTGTIGANAFLWLTSAGQLGYIAGGSGKLLYDVNATPDLALSSGAITGGVQTARFCWDGVNTAGSYNDEAKVSQAGTDTPSGTLTIGGSQVFHGSLITLIFDRVITDDEHNTLRNYYTNRLASRTLF
jgi:hypothetical protein